MMLELKARDVIQNAEEFLRLEFNNILQDNYITDALFMDGSYKKVIGITNLPIKLPLLIEMFKIKELTNYIEQLERLKVLFFSIRSYQMT